jgi:hypothetical protein
MLPDHVYLPAQKRNNRDCGCWRYIAIAWRLLMIFIVILSLKPPSLSKRDDLHAAHHQVIKQSDINQLQRLLNTRSDLTICIAGFGKA